MPRKGQIDTSLNQIALIMLSRVRGVPLIPWSPALNEAHTHHHMRNEAKIRELVEFPARLRLSGPCSSLQVALEISVGELYWLTLFWYVWLCQGNAAGGYIQDVLSPIKLSRGILCRIGELERLSSVYGVLRRSARGNVAGVLAESATMAL